MTDTDPQIKEMETIGTLVLLDRDLREVSERLNAGLHVRMLPTASGHIAIQCQPKFPVTLVPLARAEFLGYLLGGVLVAATPHELLPTAKPGRRCTFTFEDEWTDDALLAMAEL